MDINALIQSFGIPCMAGGYTSVAPYPHIAYFDYTIVSGSDYHNQLKRHTVSAELYNDNNEDKPREIIQKTELQIEAVLDKNGIHYEKTPAAFIQSENLWQTSYTFELLEVI